MINQLDEMLRHLLATRLNEPPHAFTIDVVVRPPDDAWRGTVNSNGRPAVNVYMAEVREDREQRTSAASRRPLPEPFRVDCHYLVSAWIPTLDGGFTDPTVVEDWLLGESLRIIADEAPLNATRIYRGSLPANIEPILVDNDLRTEVVPPAGYSNLADFWTGVGQGNVWHPAAHLIVTLPLVRSRRPVAPPVTTMHVGYRAPTTPDTVLHIGGTVLDGADRPVGDAWVQLETSPGGSPLRATRTDGAGRFRMYDLTAGEYRLRAVADALPESTVPVTVPSPTGTYELVLG